MSESQRTLRFDVLVVADDAGSGPRWPRPARPADARIDEVRRWFIRHGASCHPTGFGVACTMPRREAAVLFGGDPRPGDHVEAPAEIAHLVEQITVPAEPEFFA